MSGPNSPLDFKQEEIAAYIRRLLDETAALKLRLDEQDQREKNWLFPQLPFAPIGNALNPQQFCPVQVTTVVTASRKFWGTKLHPHYSSIGTLTVDTSYAKPIPVYVPLPSTLPNSGDVVMAMYTGSHGTNSQGLWGLFDREGTSTSTFIIGACAEIITNATALTLTNTENIFGKQTGAVSIIKNMTTLINSSTARIIALHSGYYEFKFFGNTWLDSGRGEWEAGVYMKKNGTTFSPRGGDLRDWAYARRVLNTDAISAPSTAASFWGADSIYGLATSIITTMASGDYVEAYGITNCNTPIRIFGVFSAIKLPI